MKHIKCIILIITEFLLFACSKEEPPAVDPLIGSIYEKNINIEYNYLDPASHFYFQDSTTQKNAIEFYNEDSLIFYQSYLVDYFIGHFLDPPLIIQDTIIHISFFNYIYFKSDNLLLLTPGDSLINMEVKSDYIILNNRKTSLSEIYYKGKKRYIWE
jgi:hypothetical protein